MFIIINIETNCVKGLLSTSTAGQFHRITQISAAALRFLKCNYLVIRSSPLM